MLRMVQGMGDECLTLRQCLCESEGPIMLWYNRSQPITPNKSISTPNGDIPWCTPEQNSKFRIIFPWSCRFCGNSFKWRKFQTITRTKGVNKMVTKWRQRRSINLVFLRVLKCNQITYPDCVLYRYRALLNALCCCKFTAERIPVQSKPRKKPAELSQITVMKWNASWLL